MSPSFCPFTYFLYIAATLKANSVKTLPKLLLPVLLPLASVAGFVLSCQQEEHYYQPETPLTRTLTMADIPTDFFAYEDTLHWGYIVPALQRVDSITPFAEDFQKEHGMPLWNFAYMDEGEEESCYFVPVWNGTDGKEIGTVWVFTLLKDHITYIPFRLEDDPDNSELKFLIDFLTFRVFGAENDLNVVLKQHTQTRAFITVSTCWDVYTGTVSTGLQYSYTNCIDHTYWVDEAYSFHWNGGGGGGAGILPESGGGGSSGSGMKDDGASSSQAKEIFENEDFADNNWQVVNDLLSQLTADCMGQELYNGIVQFLDGEKIPIRIVDNMNSNYSWKSGIFTLNVGQLSSDVLLHELFHFYQTMQELDFSFEGALLNREIEAHYAQYLFLKKTNMMSDFFKGTRGRAMEKMNEQYLDDWGNLRNEKLYEFAEDFINYNVANVFKETKPYNTYTFNEDEGLSMFQNIQLLTKNCE